MPSYSQYNKTAASIGRQYFSIGYDNSVSPAVGPPAPANLTITTSNVAGGNVSGNVFVAADYVFPSPTPGVVSPTTLPNGFVSNIANVSLTNANNSVTVTSPSASADIGNLAIGYNVFAGANANVLTLVNTSNVIPLGQNFVIKNASKVGNIINGSFVAGRSSITNTYTGESLTANTAGAQFNIPIGASNFLGSKSLTWKTTFAGVPSSVNVAIQGAYQDGPNNYVTLDYSTSTAGEVRVINPINVNFVRAYCVSVANGTPATVSIRVD
jgi:hypothetical protein